MSNYEVSETAQALFPHGVQGDILLTNTGLTSIYLESDSSVSVNTSYRLPPRATLVWSGGKPLWVLAGPRASINGVKINARLMVTRNTSPIVPATDEYMIELSNTANTGAVGSTSFTGVDCGHFKALRVNLRVDVATILTTPNDTFTITVTWRSSDNAFAIHQDVYQMWFPRDPNATDLYFVLPVQGALVNIVIAPTAGGTVVFTRLRLIGMTQESKPQFQSFFRSAEALAVFADNYSSDITTYGNFDLSWPDIYFNQKASAVDLSLRCIGVVTAAGKIVQVAGGQWIDVWDIPVTAAANAVLRKTWILPTGLSSRLVVNTAPTSAGSFDLAATLREASSPVYL